MNPKDFQHLGGVREKGRAQENQPERDARGVELPAQLFGPGLKRGFIKTAVPMGRDGQIVVHEKTLVGSKTMAIQKRSPAAVPRLIQVFRERSADSHVRVVQSFRQNTDRTKLSALLESAVAAA